MEPGWVYVLVNSSMPGLAKVGRTSRPPSERVAELSSVTGIATPFVLAFDQPVADCRAAERAVHDELDRRGLRVASNREFFRGSPSEIVRVVLEAAGAMPGAAELGARTRSAQALLEAGDRCRTGLGATLQNTGEAIRLYKLAISRGAIDAYARLGRLYATLYIARPSRAARRRAMTPLRQGAKRGDVTCYVEMATLFAAERHLGNFYKAWGLFFAAQDPSTVDDQTAAFCCRYVDECLALGLEPAGHPVVGAAAQAMVALLVAELAQARGTAAEPRLARTLRWAYLRCPLPTTATSGPPPATPVLLADGEPVGWPEPERIAA